jgi:hypothetical protein
MALAAYTKPVYAADPCRSRLAGDGVMTVNIDGV